MKVIFCGGAGEVGASCYLLQVRGKNILLDCGIRMKTAKDALPDFRRIQELGGIDAVVISHAHLDHTGSLPIISREYPNAKIYMTHATKDLIRVLLYDSLKIMNQQEAEIPIYAEKHVLDMMSRIVCYSPQFRFQLFDGQDIYITFYHAGHIAGAALVYIQSEEGTFFYTGDVSIAKQQTVNGAAIPKLRPDVAIMESTYGDKLHANRQIEEERLVQVVREVVAAGGKILIPAFALGRAQEIILLLKKAIHKKQLPQVPIYVDGMVKDINRVYKLNPNYLTNQLAKKVFKGNDIFYDDDVMPVTNQEMREQIVKEDKALCVISSSGMLTGGPSAYYAEKFASSEKHFIAITGYQDEEAPGRHILELLENEQTDKTITIKEKTIPLKCKMGKYGLSAHGDKGELQGIIQKLTPKKLFLVHGDPSIIKQLAKELQQEVRSHIYVPANGEEYDIKIKTPRKQLMWDKNVSSMNEKETLDENNIEKLWQHIYVATGSQVAYSVEELVYIWTGQTSFDEEVIEKSRALFNVSDLFVPNERKLFLYHPVEEKELMALKDTTMEMNEMLHFVERIFPEEAGLYKKGAKFEEKVCMLHFNFPQKAQEKYYTLMAEIEEKTGWKVQINKECNLGAAEELIYDLIPGDINVEKLSYYRDKGAFLVVLEDELKDHEQIAAQFKEQSGLALKIEMSGQAVPTQSTVIAPVDTTHRIEQNEAFALVENYFKDKPHKIYKKSKKVLGGMEYMELSFITPQIGNLYVDDIEKLQKQTGWPMAIGKNPNQNEMIKVVKQICREASISMPKNPSIHTNEGIIKIKLKEEKEIALKEKIENLIMGTVGYEVEIGK